MSVSQYMVALEKANATRLARADLKRKIKDNDRELLRALEDPPYFIMNCPIGELLSAQRRWGMTKTRKFLTPFNIKEHRTVEDLTKRQRDLLVSGLEGDRI
jgi:hypothetical protein